MRAAPYSPHQSYYSQPYQFYYTTTGRYCAYDASTGTHLIHNLTDNRWYPYVISPSQQYSQQQPYSYNKANDHQYQQYEYKPHGAARTGGVRSTYPEKSQFRSGERNRENREPMSRNHREEFLYSAATAEAAERSLIEDNNIDTDVFFEDEGVDVRMGERTGRSRRPSIERQRQQSQSGQRHKHEEVKHRSPPYTREPGNIRNSLGPQNNHTANHACQYQHPGVPIKHTHGPRFGSNQASVGFEGSDHDSGYMEDFDQTPEPRRNMPGVARWLDDTPSEFSVEDGQHPFDAENDGMRYTSEPHSRKVGREVIGDPPRDKPHYGKYGTAPHTYNTDPRTSQKTQKTHHTESRMASRNNEHQRSSAKTLHRQDSGIDMSEAMVDEVDIEIDIDMNDASEVESEGIHPRPGCLPRGSPHPNYVSPRRSTHRNTSSSIEEEFDCYYTIPPCPDLPPLQEATTGTAGMVYSSGRQELTAPYHLRNPPVSPTFCQPDSVYTESVAATPRPKYSHTSPAMLPRAPSPPLSPPPSHRQRFRRSGPDVPAASYERGYTGLRR